MIKSKIGTLLASAMCLTLFVGPAAADEIDDLKAQLALMKKQIEMLEARLDETESKADNAEAAAVAAHQAVGAPAAAAGGADGKSNVLAPYIKEENWADRTSIGGYGELHLNLGDKEQIDFHRWVLFVNHQFNDRVKLVSELELEHSLSGDGKPGEVELEQAYVEFDLGNDFWLKTGLQLIPIGFLNETHEPNTFYGVERNAIEGEIIPTTWWEGGAFLGKNFDSGLQLQIGGHSGLDVPVDGSNAYRIRSGRQKVANAAASDGAATLAASFNGIPGINIGAAVQHQTDISQTSPESNAAWLTEAHVEWRMGSFQLRALGASWFIDGPTPEALGLDEQYGYYVEPSYRWSFDWGDLGVFGRYGHHDAEKGNIDFYDVGINYWPLENVVFKADYRRSTGDTEEDLINFGIGYVF